MTLLPWLKHSVGIITTITPPLKQHLSHAKYCLNPFIPHSNRAVTWAKSTDRGQGVRTTPEGGEGWRWEYVDMQWGDAKAVKRILSAACLRLCPKELSILRYKWAPHAKGVDVHCYVKLGYNNSK